MIALHRDDGLRISLSDREGLRLREQSPDHEEITAVERARIPELLDSVFGLPGFVLDGEERVARAVYGTSATAASGVATRKVKLSSR
jgi:hypothetical protein